MKNIKRILALALAAVSLCAVALPVMATEGIGNGQTGVVQLSNTSTYVNMRNSASTSGTIRARLGHGTTLTVLESRSGTTVNGSTVWYRVEVVSLAGNTNASSGMTGYVHSYYVVPGGSGGGGGTSEKPWINRYGSMDLYGQAQNATQYIMNLQTDLNEWFTYVHEFDDENGNPFQILDTPGYYASWTISGVSRFQNYYDLVSDGIAGVNTKDQLWVVYKSLHP